MMVQTYGMQAPCQAAAGARSHEAVQLSIGWALLHDDQSSVQQANDEGMVQ